ncbi:MAG: hypothetical protein FVQ83_07800 [Chloroflexi bacterium]|nr:hypothetical protein [Chloroflexota bacterium]
MMTNSIFFRWSGAAAFLAGISGAAVTIMGQTQPPVPFWIAIISLLTSLIALAGINRFQKEVEGNQAQIGFMLAVAGSILLNLDIVIELTGMVYALGLIILAVVALQTGNFPRWAAWMWIASPLIGFTGIILVSLDIMLFTVGSVAFGLGFIGFGYNLWKSV